MVDITWIIQIHKLKETRQFIQVDSKSFADTFSVQLSAEAGIEIEGISGKESNT